MQLTEIGHGKRKWAVIAVVVLLIALAWSDQIDRQSRNYVDSAIVQALGAFATARVLNAGITVAKSVQVGALVTVQPLEILDPLHDLVEQYSSIMKLAIGSLITQKLLLEIVASSPFKVAITVLGLFAVTSLFVFQAVFATFFLRCFAFACLLRFLFVITLALNALVDMAFVNEKTENELSELAVVARQVERLEGGSSLSIEQQDVLEEQLGGLRHERENLIVVVHGQRVIVDENIRLVHEVGHQVQELESQKRFRDWLNPFWSNDELETHRTLSRERKGVLTRLTKELEQNESHLRSTEQRIIEAEKILSGESPRRWFAGMTSAVVTVIDFARFDGLRERLQGAVDSVLNLMALFVFKTLILPLVFLFALLRGFRHIWGIDVRTWLNNVKTELTSEPVGSSQT